MNSHSFLFIFNFFFDYVYDQRLFIFGLFIWDGILSTKCLSSLLYMIPILLIIFVFRYSILIVSSNSAEFLIEYHALLPKIPPGFY